MKKLLITAASLGVVAFFQTGCAPMIVGGAAVATGATVSTMVDRRSAGAVVNDSVLEKRVGWEISQELGKKNIDSHITVTAYNGKVLLTGEIQTAEGKGIASQVAKTSLDVLSVINELAVRENVGMMQRMSDSSLATKVRSRLVMTENVYLGQMKVVVDRGIVYLMGLVTPQENSLALVTAARTKGVARVISVCEIMSAERIQQRLRNLEMNKSQIEE